VDKGAVLKTIDRFRAIVESKKVKLDKIILFGSYANGTYKKSSDIDIILISDDFSSMDYWARIDFLTEAIYEIFEPIEAFLFTPGEWERSDSFLVDYAKDGEIVYAA
jgi:uncharacterized protein